jgi:hypothetical protein
MENNENKNKKNWTNIKIKEWKWYLGRPMIRSQLNAGPYATLRAWYRKKPAHFAYPRPGVWAAHVLTRPRCVLAAAPRPRLGLPWSPYHRRRRLNPAPRASHPPAPDTPASHASPPSPFLFFLVGASRFCSLHPVRKSLVRFFLSSD